MKNIINEFIHIKQNNHIINLLKIASEQIILPMRGNLKHNQISSKTRIDDYVTEADKLVEEYLSYELKRLLVNSVVIGEESYSVKPNLFKNISLDDFVWTCDPIDGTYNYINMSPNFCSMISLCHNEFPIACWLYFPTSRIAIISCIFTLNNIYNNYFPYVILVRD